MNITQHTVRPALWALSLGLLFAGASSAATITVDDDGPADFATISEAVLAAVDGDLIVVAPGLYDEQVIVDVSVAITGSGVGATIVTPSISNPGSGNGSQVTSTTWVFRIQRNNVTISGLTVEGNNPALSAGIDARGGIITDFTTGTYSGLEVVNCEVLNVAYRGIYAAAGGTGHSFVSNSVRNVNANFLDSVGIFFFGAQGEALNNDVEDCSIGIGFQSGGGGIIDGNAVRQCDLGILANGSTAPVSIQGNTVEDSDQGVQTVAVNTSVDVDSNLVTGCLAGLVFFGLGSGARSADGNTVDAEGLPGSSGIFATTDVSPSGFGDLTLGATNNLLRNAEAAVALNESLADNSPTLSCVLSGAATSFNTFTGNLSFNVFLDDCNDDVNATHNFWGAVSPALIEATIWHQVDDAALGLVDFSNTVNLLITVDDDGPADFTTINPAVQALLPGGTVEVRPGLYIEDVVIDRSCVVHGAGTDSNPALGTILRGASIDPDLTVVSVTASDVFLSDLRVDGQQPVYDQARRAIYASGVSGLSVTDCVIHTATTGIAYATSTEGLFLRNEVFDFGFNLNFGGGIFMWGSTGSVGVFGEGNHVHDGSAVGILYHAGSNGAGMSNLVENCPLGYLSNGASGLTVLTGNEARDCGQGYQGIGNGWPVDFVGNTAYECLTGFTLFGLGAQLHTYTDNLVRNRAPDPGSSGFFFTTDSVFGDSDLNAICRGNIINGPSFGIVLDESAGSQPFQLNADWEGADHANWITGAGSQEIFLQGCDDNIDASDNYFGSTDLVDVEDRITHQVDDPLLGLVDFSGLLAPGPDIRIRGQAIGDRDASLIYTGEPDETVMPLVGITPVNIPTQFGILRINPFVIIVGTSIEDSGLAFTEGVVPNSLVSDRTILFQALVGDGGGRALTGVDSVVTP